MKKLTPIEKARSLTIERNAKKFNELGLHKIADQLRGKNISLDKGKEKVIHTINEVDPDFVPDVDDDSDEEVEVADISQQSNLIIASASKPKPKPKTTKERTREQPHRKNKKQPLCPALMMEDFISMQESLNPTVARALEIEVQQLEQDRQIQVPQLEQEASNDLLKNGPKKKGRGPTNLFEVHAREWEDRIAIYCNDKGQPIGPPKARSQLARFLGTIAHDYNWAPLTYTSWKKVPNKEKIWEYVNSKFILPQESYNWVNETLNTSWRCFKCRVKRNHYFPYKSYEERLKHVPDGVPESHYKILLKYWETDAAKKISLQNSDNRQEQDNMHTVGPIPFAVIYEELLQKDGVAPSKRAIFERTRKRTEGRTYNRPYDDTQNKIRAMRELEASRTDEDGDIQKESFDEVMGDEHCGRVRLVGKGVSRKKLKAKETGTSFILPKEVLDSIKSVVTAEVQKDLAAEKEALAQEKEALAQQFAEVRKLSKDLQSHALTLQCSAQPFEAQKEPLTLDTLGSALAQMRKNDPNITPQMIAQVIVSSASTAVDDPLETTD